MRKPIGVFAIAVVCSVFIIGCGDDGGTDVKITPPTVTQTFPQNGATAVGLVPLISVSFSEEMDASSLAGISVTGIATHHVDYDTLGNKATVYISQPLAGETAYEVTVPAEVKDAEGHSMGSDYTFSFTSAALDCANAADYFEPNNATNETTEVEIPCTFPVLSSCGGDERKDYYSFTLGEAKKVTVRLRRIDGGSAASWSTSLLRGFYQIYAFGDSLRTTEETSNYYTFLPGTYTFSTGKQNEDDDIVFYSLTIETSSPCPDDVYEDNDFYFEATAIDPGSYTDLMSCYRDQDFYAIDVSAGQTLTVTADNLSGLTFDGGVYIWDPDDAFAVKDTGTHDPLSASWTAAVGGTYTFSVAWHLGEVEYSMVVEVE